MLRKKAFTTGEVAKLCNVTINTVVKWFESGELKGYKLPSSGARRIPREELVKFMKKHGIPTGELEFEGNKVLSVSSDKKVHQAIKKALPEHRGYTVSTTDDFFEASMYLGSEKPDIVFVDVTTVEGDPAKLVKSIRKTEGLKDTRLVAVVESADKSTVNKVKRWGFNDYIKKPIRATSVERRIRRQLGRLV